MNGCTIHPIPIFHRQKDLSASVFRIEPGRMSTIAGFVWYIKGAGQKILVDGGASVEYIRNVKGEFLCEEVQTLEQGLAKLGLSCTDIDLVIFTHLHHDHICQASRLTNARLIAQRDEIDSAYNPHPFFANAYPKEFLNRLNFDAIEGDVKITDKISVIKTPGHTKGGQSIAIKTAKGLAIISGMCSMWENFEPSLIGSKLPVIPPTPHENVPQVYDSMLKIKQMADILIPNHDSKYLKIEEIP